MENFIETGFYLEQFLPLKRVRFISINDGWDSVVGVTNQNPLGRSSRVNKNYVRTISNVLQCRKGTSCF